MSRPVLRVLLTEDSAADAELELRELKRAGLAVSHRTVDTEPAFIGALRDFAPDVILSDFSMPGFDGMAALALARAHSPYTPFIFVSGTIGEEYAIRALRNGATDYVLKSNLLRLPAAVERAVAEARERDERRRADAEQRARIERLSRIRELLGALSGALIRARDRDTVFGEFCRIAASRGGFVLARIIERDAQGRARIAATTEADPSLYQAMVDAYNRDPAGARSLLARALRSGAPMISNDVAADERVENRAELTRAGNYSLALLPVMVGESVAAVAILRAREPGSFDHEELRLLQEMISNIAFALEFIAKQDRIAYLALYDTLTGLPNRTLFHERLSQAIRESRQRGAGALAVALVDLERFKAINDTYGQRIGDRVLQAVAQRLRDSAGDLQRVARLGSDHFGLVYQGISGAEEVGRRLDERQSSWFGAPVQVEDQEVRLAAKVGVAVFPEDGADADSLFRNAEAALKRAKETGERQVFYAPAINARVAEQVELERRLRKAVDNGEIFLHFQPKYELPARRICGVEALARWKGPDGKLVPPSRFVPVLEQTGLILEASRQAFAGAAAAYRKWQARVAEPPRVAVNLSSLLLRRRTFVEDVRAALGDATPGSGGVDLEITESLLMSDIEESIRKLGELRASGMHIALDDFGTGYSSLAYLSRLPIDTVKIDRSFVHNMVSKAEDASIVSAILSLARALNLRVVAEGVETEVQALLLDRLGCDELQGFLFSPAVPAEAIESLL